MGERHEKRKAIETEITHLFDEDTGEPAQVADEEFYQALIDDLPDNARMFVAEDGTRIIELEPPDNADIKPPTDHRPDPQ